VGKALATIAIITASVALVATGVGAIAGGAALGSLAIGGVSVSTLFTVASGLSIVAGFLNRPKATKPDTTVSSQRQSIPPRIRARGRSRLHAYWSLYETASDGSTVDLDAFMDGPSDGNELIYINDEVVTVVGETVQTLPDKKYQNGLVNLGMTFGAMPNTAFGAVIAKIPGVTSFFRGDGVCTGYLIKRSEKEKYYAETYPQGDNTDFSRVDRWGLCYDPRDPDMDVADSYTRTDMWSGGVYIGSWKWTENPVLHTLDYMMTDRGYEYAKRFLPTVEFWKTAADVCDEAIPLKAGGTEPRYRSCLSYAATSLEKEVLASYFSCFDGWMQERGDGAFIIYAGKIYTPTVTIGPDEIINASLQNFVETENGIDQVKVTYISSLHDYTEVEATPWGGENGSTRTGSIDAVTPSFSQNRRLAKRIMDRTNSAERGSITTTLAGRSVRGQRYIYLNHTEGDIVFFAGVVEILKLSRNFETGGLDFDWVAVDPNIDAWNPATEEGEGAAVGDRVAPEPLEVPIITDATAVYDQSGQDSTGTRIAVTVTGPDRDDLKWYLRWKKSTASVWKEDEYNDTDPGSAVEFIINFVPVDTSIDIEVEYQIGDGRLSGYSATYTLDTSTDAVAPDPATSITLTNWSDTLDLVTDYIARARSYRWRFYASDGTTLVRTLLTSGRTVSYTAAQAAVDGARRAYIVHVAGLNGAGAGTEALTGTLTLAAPAAITGVSATGGATDAEIDFTEVTGVAGYSVAYSTASGFDPLTQGTIQKSLASPTYLQGLAAATFYAKVAAYDAWTDRPDLLNYSTPEVTFAITTGGGGTGGGGGDGGGGYCPVEDELILMADGTQKRAGDIVVGDIVRTQHEITHEWGDYPVEAVSFTESDDVWSALGFKATAGHKTWLSGTWNRHDTLGVPVPGTFRVVRITVENAHTYICAGVLSHNLKPTE